MKKLGFVIPVFNSERTLIELHSRIKSLAESIALPYHVVFVNDDSPDNSWQVLESIKRENITNVTIIKLYKNSGQHNAILCGLQNCPAEYIITLDDDLQTPPEESKKLFDYILATNDEVVYGIYEDKQHSAFRNFGSFLIQKIFAIVFKTKGHISSFRILHHQLKNRIVPYKTRYVFIDGFIHWETTRIGRIVVDHQKRKYGRSGYTFAKLLKLTANLLFNFTTIPLSFIVALGALCSTASFGLGIMFIIRKLIYDVPLGFTAIIVSIFFSTGLTLMVIGIIGEYLRRLYLSNLNSPQYSVEKIIE